MVFLRRLGEPKKRVRLQGLVENWRYRIEETGEVLTGRTLMNRGVELSTEKGDFSSIVYHFVRVDSI